ncbi:MAG: hypothetical protein ABH824_04895 [Nanoarchaeota archaeon]|nr:hypothetical protein [Nanoarchaeota archaeon]MBU1631769.1 hypothetical protein [Nanoarchaeota archaeon]MBU1876169.1 hypothetical protein [Nanoarchaeota archaeon]
MKKILSLLGLITLLVFLTSCSFVPAEKKCSADKDCVPASCCHAKDAVNKEHGPDCAGMLCTAVCEPETIDCGQGDIKCVSGECKAVMKE